MTGEGCSITLGQPPQVRIAETKNQTSIAVMVGMKLIVGTPKQWQQLWDTVSYELYQHASNADSGRAV